MSFCHHYLPSWRLGLSDNNYTVLYYILNITECTISNLTITMMSYNVTATTRTTVIIACVARGVSEPSITWDFNDITINNDTSERVINVL